MPLDDEFRPRLGRIRTLGDRHGRSYLGRVVRATNLAGGSLKKGRARVDGSRVGVGAGVGRVLAGRDRFAAYRSRRVIVKFSYAKMSGAGKDAARAHMRYIQRDGVTKDGERGSVYSADRDRTDGTAFVARAETAEDRHQFRFIISPEDSAQYDDLKPLTRRLMAQMETDLDTSLDWVAVDHHNTGHPHTHVIVRGRNDRGKDLVIAREYLTHGIRERAAELVALDLGPRTDLEVETRLRAEMDQDRLTSIDRRLIRDMAADRTVLANDHDVFMQALRAGRLQKLGRLGLAEEIAPGRWRLNEGLDQTLRRMGERGDIIRTLQRAISASGLDRTAKDYAVFDPDNAPSTPLVGRLVDRGLSDEHRDRHYLVVDGLDGRTYFADVGRSEGVDTLPVGAIVRLDPRLATPRALDRTIAEIAAANGGRYDLDLHLRADASATSAFAQTHIRRLEALRRGGSGVVRDNAGTWTIPDDYLDRVKAYEQRQRSNAPMVVQMLSPVPLDQQVSAEGATWLDRRLVAPAIADTVGSGFGQEVRRAQDRRRQWLIAQGLAELGSAEPHYRPDLLSLLQRRDLAKASAQLSGELNLDYVEVRAGQRIEGRYRGAVQLVSGRFAIIERSREFSLVPWRPVLERHVGKQVSGIMRGDSINWTIGRQLGGPTIG